MSASPANKKSLHGYSSSPLTRGPQVSAITDVDPKSSEPPRTVASRSSRQPRLSFSSLSPSSDRERQKKAKSDENPPRREQPPAAEEEDDEEKRSWNLRPRKACGGGSKKGNGALPAETIGGGGASEAAKSQKPVVAVAEAKSNRQRGIPAESPGLGAVEAVKSENHRLWVALSRDEIEEDVFSMSGNRPSRRPRKRAKTLQKHLDVMFPGLCLVGMNADCFRISNFSR